MRRLGRRHRGVGVRGVGVRGLVARKRSRISHMPLQSALTRPAATFSRGDNGFACHLSGSRTRSLGGRQEFQLLALLKVANARSLGNSPLTLPLDESAPGGPRSRLAGDE